MEPSELRLDHLVSLVEQMHPDAPALLHLRYAVLVGERLGELADHLVGHFVDQARRAGATWAQIGEHLGVSKQAAQQRFVPRGTPPEEQLSRFTQRAQHVVKASKEAAVRFGHQAIGTEHLVLGLLAEPNALAALALAEQGVTAEQIRAAVAAVLPPASGAASDEPRYTPRAKKVLELALREALRLGHNYIGTEHLLLSILDEPDSLGAQVLLRLGVDRDRAERWMLIQLAEHAGGWRGLLSGRPRPRGQQQPGDGSGDE